MRQGRLIDDDDDSTTAVVTTGPGSEEPESTEGLVLDYITNKYVPDSPKEQVRQQVARALFHEYGLSPDDMERDFPVPVEGGGRIRRKRVEIAIFSHKQPHTLEHLRRVVVCRQEPKNGRRSVAKLRDHRQARKDIEELWQIMAVSGSCHWGMWTNNLDHFYYYKEDLRFGPDFKERAGWPLAEEIVGTKDVQSIQRLRRADPDMLRVAFRRCHNFIHGNEGMPKDAAFWQFLYLIFAKMYDERHGGDQFRVRLDEPFDAEGRKQIRARVQPLFERVKREYGPGTRHPIFRGNEEIILTDRAFAFLVAELAGYDFTGSDIDAKGLAYQELVGTNLRGDRGQYFTPRRAINLMVELLDPKEHERVLDPACGTGGFLAATLKYLLDKWKREEGTYGFPDIPEDLERHQARLLAFADDKLFGADFDPFLVRATSMNLLLAANTTGNVFHMDSLLFPKGDLAGVKDATERIKLGSIDVLMTNPPFGTDIPINDPEVLDQYADGVARKWSRRDSELVFGEGRETVVAPEVLFVQRAVDWVTEGGRVGIVLPDGMLSNPGSEHIRRWILENCWVLASIDMPVETFIVEANVNILTTLLFLKKKTREERHAEALGARFDYPVFMAVAERVGVDRRGNSLYRRTPDGEILFKDEEFRDSIRVNNEIITRKGRRRVPEIDNDLPEIARKYKEFRERYPEPPEGLRR
jgi:type I restriction enzyme M protein